MKEEEKKAFVLDEFPRSAKYDPEWMMWGWMGPNAVWLAEALSQVMDLHEGMRVLDLGSGKGVSSVFLAKEFGVRVWAGELWMDPDYVFKGVEKMDSAESVFPMKVDAHYMPFPQNYFDAIVTIDAYHYFGADDLKMNYISKFVRPGGQIGIVVPGLTKEINGKVPEHLKPYWEPEFHAFHTPEWWKRVLENTGKVEIETADLIPNGWEHWMKWEMLCDQHELERHGGSGVEMLKSDQGRNLGFTRVVAKKI